MVISNPKNYMDASQIWYDKPIHEGHVSHTISSLEIFKEYAQKVLNHLIGINFHYNKFYSV
jgi:hypothetical protein